MNSGPGSSDWQRIEQWIGTPLVTQNAYPIGAGSHTFGPFTVSSWAGLILRATSAGATTTFTLRANSAGAAGTIDIDQEIAVGAGAVEAQPFPLYGDTVFLIVQGGGVGSTVTFDLIPTNTISNTKPVVLGGASTPTGAILPFSGATAPSGFVLCDGSHYDGTTATYAGLWAIIGTTYGGTAQADFAVPDLRGRVPVGLATGGKAAVAALGDNEGLAANLRSPSHHHSVAIIWAPGASANSAGGNVVWQNGTEGSTGDSDNTDKPAYLVINYIVAL